MTSEEILNRLIDKGHDAYKHNFRKYCPTVARMLDKKVPVEINGQEYRCWQELVIDNIGQLIQEYCQGMQVEVVLDMNNSFLSVDEITEADEEIIMTKIKGMVAK